MSVRPRPKHRYKHNRDKKGAFKLTPHRLEKQVKKRKDLYEPPEDIWPNEEPFLRP